MQFGTFIKTASYQAVELLGGLGLDFAVIDAEHAALDRLTIDAMMVAGRAVDLPLFVRVADHRPADILAALDMGAAGVLVPHVDTENDARAIVRAAKYVGGARGYSGSPRAGGFGALGRDEMVRQGDATKVICQIECAEAVANADAIAAVEGVDGVFLGRADLALSMGVTAGSPQISHAVSTLTAAAQRHAKHMGMFVASPAELASFRAAGADWFILGSDQAFLRGAVSAAARQVRDGQG